MSSYWKESAAERGSYTDNSYPMMVALEGLSHGGYDGIEELERTLCIRRQA